MKTISSHALQHGDVLLYNDRLRHSSFYVDGIHLITGAKYEHSAIIWEENHCRYVLEQLELRTHTLLKYYHPLPYERIWAFRPTFDIPHQWSQYWFQQAKYGYSTVTDCLINHLLGRLTLNHWRYRPLTRKFWQSDRIDCSGLVAEMLELTENTDWCEYPSTIEPGTFALHPESFTELGEVVWS